MKTFDGPEAAADPSIAVDVLVSLVHLLYIGYFMQQLIPELRTMISEWYDMSRRSRPVRSLPSLSSISPSLAHLFATCTVPSPPPNCSCL